MLLKKYFCNLNENDLHLLEKYFHKLIKVFCECNYINTNDFIIFLNNNENTLVSFVLLLLPFYSKTVNNIFSLRDLYFNSIYTNKYSEIESNSIENILFHNFDSLKRTIKICSNKFYVNDLEIKPIFMNEYKNTQLYLDTLYKIENDNFDLEIGLCNDDIFNTICNDLYYNLKNIEWILKENNILNIDNKNNAIIFADKYFNHYNLHKEFSIEKWDLYMKEVIDIYEHSWYSKNNSSLKNIDIFHFCKKIASNNEKKIWFSLDKNQQLDIINEFKKIDKKIKIAFVDIIFESLIIKGCLSKFDFHQNLKKEKNDNYYFFLTGKEHPVMKNSFYTMNWLSQINFFHHFISHRIIFLTGGTGVGKSTQAPILLMYSDIMIYYDLYSQILCSVPRKNAVENNAIRIRSQLLLEKDTHYNIQFQHSEANYLFPLKYSKINLKIVTDEILKNTLKKNLYCIEDNKILTNHILIDESHEHKINMDIILSILKHSLFLYNNHTKLFIISATMDEDDLNYRQFFKSVNDCDIRYKLENRLVSYLDRRLHISEYKKLNNFTIKEFYSNDINLPYEKAEKKAISIIKDISFSTKKGTILGFSIGIREIENMIIELNKIIPTNTIAIPLYSKYAISYRNAVSSNFLDMWIYDRTYILEILKNYESDWNSYNLPFPKKKYSRYIIIGTNIVEASLTINSLKYVVDTGFEKVAIYNYKSKKERLHVLPISESSRIQRKGRVGRVSDGFVYYTYTKDERKNNKIQKEIQNQDISSYIFDIIGFKKINSNKLNNLMEENKEIFLDGFDYEQISKNNFFIIKPSLDINEFFRYHQNHFLWKSLFNEKFYNYIQDLKLNYLMDYLDNYQAITILYAYNILNKNEFIFFLKKNILNDENFIFRKINIIDPKKCKEKDCNFSINLLLSFLEKNKMKMYYQEINKNNITNFLSM